MKCTNPTRHGAAVVARKAKNGRTTFSLKYHDAAGELVWRMPLHERFTELVKG